MKKHIKRMLNKLLFRYSFAEEVHTLVKVFPRTLVDNKEMLLLGSSYGGWYLPQFFAPTSTDICYCIGAGEDISFDCALASKYSCPVYIFDPTPKAFKHYSDVAQQLDVGCLGGGNFLQSYAITRDDFRRIEFSPIGVSHLTGMCKFYFPENPAHVSCSTNNIQNTNAYFEADCCTIQDILAQNNHSIPYLIKMDIEGAEYSVLQNILEDNVLPKFLAVEFHALATGNTHAIFYATLTMLKKAGMTCIHSNWPDVVFMRESGDVL